MYRPYNLIPAFNPVAPGAKAKSQLLVGPSYHNFVGRITKGGALVTLANLGTDVAFIRFIADGNTFRTITPALLLTYLRSRGLSAALQDGSGNDINSFIIPFSDPTRREVEGEELLRLGTVGVRNLVMEVEFKNPGAVVYTLDVWAETDSIPKPFAYLETWTMETLDIVNGTKSYTGLSVTDDYLDIFLQSADITRVLVKADKAEVFDATKNAILSSMRMHGYVESAASYFPVSFSRDRQITDVLPVAIRDEQGNVVQRVGQIQIDVTATAAANIDILRCNLWRG